ncbi:hypothetical protein ACFLS1_02880 [Verrucomicrobiota bacterium]
MNIMILIRLILAYCYAVLPYVCLILAFIASFRNIRSIFRELFISTVAGTAAFCFIATAVTNFSFDFYFKLHLLLIVSGIITMIWRRVKITNTADSAKIKRSDILVLVILVLALAVRVIPVIAGGESFGDNDARFHNILAQKILLEQSIASTWAPFAPINVVYPQGTHVLIAFIAKIANCPVHQAFNVLIALIGALTVGMIYLLADLVFHSEKCALFSASVYAFLPLWGSLDYYRWGGLPNMTGMLILCLLVMIILEKAHAQPDKKNTAIIAAAFCLAAIMTVHHYTLVAAAVFLGFGFLFTANRELRLMILGTVLLGSLVCLPLFLLHYPISPNVIGAASVFKFREPVIPVVLSIHYLSPVFVALFILAMFTAKKISWNSHQLLILAWFAGTLTAFVALEYFYRAGVLISTCGQDFFTALTPSRMLTNLVYPMSILCGFVPISAIWIKNRRTCVVLFTVLSIMTCSLVWQDQIRVGVFPDVEEAAVWLNRNTPEDSMVVGNLPHLEYLSWRETSNPPLPASETRNHLSVTWKKEITTFDEWLKWHESSGRAVYFLLSAKEFKPAFLTEVFSNNKVSILTYKKKRKI